MTSTPPSSHHSQSGKTTPFRGSPASSRNGDQPAVGVQQQQQQPADSFGGDWSVSALGWPGHGRDRTLKRS
jgi:hypothetical protein